MKNLALPVSQCTNSKRYLVESCGELLQVNRNLHIRDGRSRVMIMFKIFRLDIDTRKWPVMIRNLGEVTLFLGDNTSISALTSNFLGCQPNRIYAEDSFTEAHGPYICDLGVYEVESKNFKLHYTIDSAILSTMSIRSPIWFEPLMF